MGWFTKLALLDVSNLKTYLYTSKISPKTTPTTALTALRTTSVSDIIVASPWQWIVSWRVRPDLNRRERVVFCVYQLVRTHKYANCSPADQLTCSQPARSSQAKRTAHTKNHQTLKRTTQKDDARTRHAPKSARVLRLSE